MKALLVVIASGLLSAIVALSITHDISGGAAAVAPARPGSDGLASVEARLAPIPSLLVGFLDPNGEPVDGPEGEPVQLQSIS